MPCDPYVLDRIRKQKGKAKEDGDEKLESLLDHVVHRLFDAWADGVLMTESETLEFAQAVKGVGAWECK